MAKAPAATPLPKRIESALREGRLPQALELAKQHVRYEPGDEANALLRKTYLRLAEHHSQRGAFRDVHSILSEAEKHAAEDPAFRLRLAELRADAGDYSRALQLIQDDPAEATLRPKILARAVDRAMREGAGGRAMIPDDLKPQFDAIRKAFAEYEALRDEAAREAMNAIGLASPFLEWKLMLRGLMAWNANDTPRAIDNWSRLTPERLPAKLAAPIRFTIDRSFLAALPADQQTLIARQSEQLSGGIVEGLRRIRKQLASEDLLPDALHSAQALVPELGRIAPHLVPRLANIFYWAILSEGQPEDLPKFSRIFGAPPDDPSFFRMQALVMETMRQFDKAHGFWKKYEEWIAKSPNRWPPAQGDRARSLIFERMGALAFDWLDSEDDDDDLDVFFSMFARNTRKPRGPRKALSPSSAECFQKASELAPDRVEPALAHFQSLPKASSEADAAMEKLLERFPNQLRVQLRAAAFYEERKEKDKARECIRRALAANPLDRDLRSKVALITLDDARQKAIDKDFDGALAAMKEAVSLGSDRALPVVHAISAAMYVNAKKPEDAARHLEALEKIPNGRLANAYRLLVEGTRVKLKKKELTPWTDAFETQLAAPLNLAELDPLLSAHADYLAESNRYRGHLTHQKKIFLRLLNFAYSPDTSEEDRVRIGVTLLRHGFTKPMGDLGKRFDIGHRPNPYFTFFVLESKLAKSKARATPNRLCWQYSRLQQRIRNNPAFRELQDLIDERAKNDPDIRQFLDDFDDPFGF